MASFQTFFRTVVMLATLGIVAKAWYLYGPTVDEMKVIGTRAAEVAQKAWTDYWQKSNDGALADDDPRLPTTSGPPAPFVPGGAPMDPMPHSPGLVPQTATANTVQLAGGVPAEVVQIPASPEPTRLPPNSAEPSQDAQISAFTERLKQLGARDQELAPWGSRGELVRFRCNVPWANSPAYSRHFEAVAATPLAAVQQVTAEIEAWQSAQQRAVSSSL
jgi:hypothetical protein